MRLIYTLEVNFSVLRVISKKQHHLDRDKATKPLVLRNLESAIERLKEARTELHWAVIEAIEMGTEADDIADDVFYAVVEAFKEDWVIKDAQ
jgi:hypothetical protein